MKMFKHDYEVEYAIVALLLANETLKDLVGDKVFPVYIDRDTEGDAVYYDSRLEEPSETKMGIYERHLRFRVCAVSWDMDKANRIVAAIQDELEGIYTDEPWYKIIAVASEKDAADKKYFKAMEFLIDF